MLNFFIVGCGRSGTTMLQQALNRHNRIAIPPETAFFSHFLGYLGHMRWTQARHLRWINKELQIDLPMPASRIRTPAEARNIYERMARLYVERIGKPETTCFGEKTPYHLLHLPRLMQVYPEAKVILVYRDGRDVALSLSKVPWVPPNVYAGFALWLRAYRWHRWALRQKTLDLLCIRYEDLTRDPAAELHKITDFLNLPYDEAMAEGCDNREGVPGWELTWKARAFEKISTARIGVWRTELTPQQVQDFERWGGHALTGLGYGLATYGRGRFPYGRILRAYWQILALRTRLGYRLVKRTIAPGAVQSLGQSERQSAGAEPSA
jgi:hypothetical protein